MKNKMKKILCIFLVVLMCITSAPLLSEDSLIYDLLNIGAHANNSSISIGDTITLGTYNDNRIVWECVDIDENGPLMMSKEILCKKEYDAAGTNTTYHTDGWANYIRSTYGSSCWYDSNIRQWLNSDEASVSWTHCPPSYSNESGFMTNFTENEKQQIKTVERIVNINIWETTRKNYCDGGSSDTVASVLTNTTFNPKTYYYKTIEDSVFLLDAVQYNNLYNKNRSVLSSTNEYWTCINGGNNYACYEHVLFANVDGNTNLTSACTSLGIRPAFYLNVEAYDSSPKYIAGYSPLLYQYGFTNTEDNTFVTVPIEIEYYMMVYGPIIGSTIWFANINNQGLCYGMSATAGMFIKHCDQMKKLSTTKNDCTYPVEHLADITNPSDVNYSKMTLLDLIKLAHISQHLPSNASLIKNDTKSLLESVKYAIHNNGDPVVVNLVVGNVLTKTKAHTVLAYGYKETDQGYEIYVDDPNLIETSPSCLLIAPDHKSWKYLQHPEYNSNDGYLDFNCFDLALFIDAPFSSLYNAALLISASNAITSHTTCYPIYPKFDSGSNSNNPQLYWTKKNVDNITLSSETTDFITVASALSSISATVFENTDAHFVVNNKTNSFSSTAPLGETIKITFSTIDLNEEVLNLTINGIVNDSSVSATQTETGLVVTGISNGTVTLSTNNEIVSVQEIKNAVGEIKITYDDTGKDENVNLNYHTHSYSPEITTPATHTTEGIKTFTCSCGDSYKEVIEKSPEHTYSISQAVTPSCTEKGYTTYTCACGDTYNDDFVSATGHNFDGQICESCGKKCSHLCHKTGFLGFIWKIVRFFWKLFKINPNCVCETAHY